MASAPSAAATPPSNWFSEWAARTPVVSRYALFIVTPVTILGLLVPVLGMGLSLTPTALTRGEVWRFVTALPYQGGLLAFVFSVLMLVTQAPALESELGSLRFITRAGSWGLIINVLWAVITAVSFGVWPGFGTSARVFGAPMASGLWPVLMAFVTQRCLADPGGTTRFICITLPNRAYPWFLLLIFGLLSWAVPLHLLLGVLLGHAAAAGALGWVEPSPRRLATWEVGVPPPPLVRWGVTSAAGYAYSPDTPLPPDVRLQREAAAGALGARMGGGAAAAGGGSGGGGGFSLFRTGRTGAAAPASAAAAASGGSGGTGGGTGGGGGASFAGPGRSLRAPGAAATAPALLSGAAGAAAERERRAALAAAAEARAARARTSPSPRATAPAVASAGAAVPVSAAATAAAEADRASLLPAPLVPSAPPVGASPAAAAAAAATAAASEDWEVSVALLESMGYARVDAEAALQDTGGDVEAAVMLLEP